jgi:hypothetical protein
MGLHIEPNYSYSAYCIVTLPFCSTRREEREKKERRKKIKGQKRKERHQISHIIHILRSKRPTTGEEMQLVKERIWKNGAARGIRKI